MEKTGSGYGSEVYKVEHIKLHAVRAMKCIHKEKVSYEKIMREAIYLKSFRHPGIPVLYDMEEDDICFYIIEEFISGASIKSLLSNRQTITQLEIINIGIQLCDIVGYLHSMQPYPVIHGDISDGNIMLQDGQVKLIDFGNASKVTGKEQQQDVYGTRGFVDTQTMDNCKQKDIYGICALLQKMLYEGSLAEEKGKAIYRKQKKLERILNKIQTSDCERVQDLREQLLTLDNNRQYTLEKSIFHFFEKDTTQEKNICRTYGIIGITPSCGVTTMAFYIASQRKISEKTALVEYGEQKDLGKWKLWQEENGIKTEYIKYGFSCEGIDFYPMADREVMSYVCNQGYEAIIVDYGLLTEKNQHEISLCNKKIVLGKYCKWSQRWAIHSLELLTSQLDTNDWIYMSLFYDKSVCKNIEHKLGIHIDTPFPQINTLLSEYIDHHFDKNLREK